ncbi:unnamed protein product [Protopolystoma xenopodis]|uniref:Uncharacterized protein n=1 Tax=Protopolystoma xenopodis TaxID=117903 RepID=A0A448WXW8_9PLAT|nr:unnamed protein product [Protopolystoma xenopodis]
MPPPIDKQVQSKHDRLPMPFEACPCKAIRLNHLLHSTTTGGDAASADHFLRSSCHQLIIIPTILNLYYTHRGGYSRAGQLRRVGSNWADWLGFAAMGGIRREPAQLVDESLP